jgi:hypothetical protein
MEAPQWISADRPAHLGTGAAQALRHQLLDGHADELVPRVARQRFGAAVDTDHAAAGIDHDDRVWHRLQQLLGGTHLRRPGRVHAAPIIAAPWTRSGSSPR